MREWGAGKEEEAILGFHSTMRFSKYEFYIKLLGDIILLRVIPGVT